MADEVESAIAAADPTAAAPEAGASVPPPATGSTIPQVGDVTPRGSVIQGVRIHVDGGIEISFNGADFEPA